MWIVYTKGEGIVGIKESHEEAFELYEASKKALEDYVDSKNITTGIEEVFIAKIEKRFVGQEIEEEVMSEDPGGNMSGELYKYWDWKEEEL